MDASAPDAPLDRLVLGATLPGMQRALRALRAGERVLVVDRAAQPGGEVRTMRSEGYRCELGPFALAADEFAALTADLEQPPPGVDLLPGARTGALHDGTSLRETPVEGRPQSGRGGLEDLVTAYRRELGASLWLGREATAVTPETDGAGAWSCRLGGEVEATLRARNVHLHMSTGAATQLLAHVDAPLQGLAPHLRWRDCALVFVGTWQDERSAAALRGYGVLVDSPGDGVREIIHCSNAFAGCAMPGKALVRVEVGPGLTRGDDAEVAASAEQALRDLTGLSSPTLFVRVHRYREPVRDSTWVEATARLHGLAASAPGFDWTAQ